MIALALTVESRLLLGLAVLLLAGAWPLAARPAERTRSFGDSMRPPKSRKQQADDVLRDRLAVANLDGLVTEPVVAWGGLVVAMALAGWVVARSAGALVGVAGAVALPVVVTRLRGDQSERRIEDALPDVLEAAARNLRTGSPLLQALDQAVSYDGASAASLVHDDIAEILHGAARGVAVGACFDAWALRRPFAAVRTVVATIHVGLSTGADLAAPLEQAADGLRSTSALRAEVSALAAQAKASVVVIGLAPLAFLGVSTASGTSAQSLFGSPLGVLAMSIGLLLDIVGVLWMRRIIGGVTA